jgi:hypothetical protein
MLHNSVRLEIDFGLCGVLKSVNKNFDLLHGVVLELSYAFPFITCRFFCSSVFTTKFRPGCFLYLSGRFRRAACFEDLPKVTFY